MTRSIKELEQEVAKLAWLQSYRRDPKFHSSAKYEFKVVLKKSLTMRDRCNWCNANCQGNYSVESILAMSFELSSDAVMFKLRWG